MRKILLALLIGAVLAVIGGDRLIPPPQSAAATTLSTIMLAPAAGQSFTVPSGNTYVSTPQALIVNVAEGDITSLQQLGCILLTPRNNVSATRAPGGTDDFTGSYGVGSQWVDVSGVNPPRFYILVSMTTTPGSATWRQIGALGALASTGIINSSDYGVTSTAPDSTTNAQAAID